MSQESSRDAARDLAADRLSRAAIVLALLAPVLSIFSRGVAAPLLVVVTLLLLAAGRAAKVDREAIGDLRGAAPSPGSFCALALAVFAGASAFWALEPARGALHALHFGGSLVLAALACVLVARLVRSGSVPILAAAAAIGLASTIALIELHTEGVIRAALGLRVDYFRLNRAMVAIMLLLPVTMALLLWRGWRLAAFLLAILAAAAIMLSVSNSAKLGILVALVVGPAAVLAPRVANRAVGVAAVAAMLAMPFVAPIANDLVPGWLHARPGFASMTVRGEVWREMAPFLAERPILGWGLEATQAFARIPGIEDVGPERLFLLIQGHPHNAPLQIWLELGLVGALLAAAALGFGFRALERLPAHLLPAATTTAAIAFAIACVSHGAWQAWWWGLLGLVAVAFAAAVAGAPPPRESR